MTQDASFLAYKHGVLNPTANFHRCCKEFTDALEPYGIVAVSVEVVADDGRTFKNTCVEEPTQ